MLELLLIGTCEEEIPFAVPKPNYLLRALSRVYVEFT